MHATAASSAPFPESAREGIKSVNSHALIESSVPLPRFYPHAGHMTSPHHHSCLSSWLDGGLMCRVLYYLIITGHACTFQSRA